MPKRFRSKEAYNKYVAHIHIHDIPHTPGKTVKIAGRTYKPKVPESEKKCSKIGYCGYHRQMHY